jgi:D-arabinose 1-dehydrogenase-like Zn-dependent alcohol dehydrogenase
MLFDSIRKSITVGGRWILVGQLSGEFVPFNPAQLFLKNISMISATSTTRNQLRQCLELVASGSIRPVVSKRMPLSEVRRAHEIVEAGAVAGRIVLQPAA